MKHLSRFRGWSSGPDRAIQAVVSVGILTAIGSCLAWVHYSDDAARLAAVAAITTGGALALAIIAGVIATMAYKDSSLRPNLHAQLYVASDDDPGVAVHLSIAKDQSQAWPGHGPVPSLPRYVEHEVLHLHVLNDGPVAARHVLVRVWLSHLAWWPTDRTRGFHPPDRWSDGEWDISVWGLRTRWWEGGADTVIYGDGEGRGWDLRLDGLWTFPDTDPDPRIYVLVVADRFPKQVWQFSVSVTDAVLNMNSCT